MNTDEQQMSDAAFDSALKLFEQAFSLSPDAEPRGICFFDDYTGTPRWIKSRADAEQSLREGFTSKAMCRVYSLEYKERFGEDLHD